MITIKIDFPVILITLFLSKGYYMKKFIQLFILATMATILVACGGDKKDAAQVAETTTKAMFEGDAKTVIENLYTDNTTITDADKKQAESVLSIMFQAMKAEVDKAGGIQTIKAGEVTLNADKTEASVPVTITLNKAINGKQSDTQTINLRKIDGKWKIVMQP